MKFQTKKLSWGILEMKVSIKPIEELIIHNITKMSEASMMKFARNQALLSGRIPHLNWCNGVLFEMNYFGGDDTIKEEKDGIIRWAYFLYAEMEKFREKIELENGGIILITDSSENPLFKEAIDYIKANHREVM